MNPAGRDPDCHLKIMVAQSKGSVKFLPVLYYERLRLAGAGIRIVTWIPGVQLPSAPDDLG